MRAPAGLLLAVVLGCGEAGLEPAEFADHCGVAGPVRLLKLPPERILAHSQAIGDRLYHTVADLVPPDDGHGGYGFPIYTNQSTWSTGACGESPVHILDGVNYVFSEERWPGVALACVDGTGIVSLDPEGELAPHTVFAAEDCNVQVTDHGLVRRESLGEAASPLLLYPFPDDPRTGSSAPQVLLPAVSSFRGGPDVIDAIDADGTLVRIDLPGREVTVVQTRVRDFVYSPDRRYLLWMDQTLLQAEPPSAIVSLRDEAAGTAVSIGEAGSLSQSAFRWADRGLLVFPTGGVQRVYFLPGMAFIDAPAGYALSGDILDDDRWPVTTGQPTRDPWLALFDLHAGTLDPLFQAYAWFLARDPDAFIVRTASEGGEGPVWRVPHDGTPPRKLARRATTLVARPDASHLVTPVAVGADHLGTLLLVDVDTQAERRIDDHVFITGFAIDADDPASLTYVVQDGERSGVWTARLPAGS